MPYRFVDGVAMADVAFEATGATLEELFKSAGEALMATQVKGVGSVRVSERRKLELAGEDEERLLHNFLQELIFYKDAEELLFSEYVISIGKGGAGLALTGSAGGEKIDRKRHELIIDVKAVSWHMFRVERSSGGWRAFVILDV